MRNDVLPTAIFIRVLIFVLAAGLVPVGAVVGLMDRIREHPIVAGVIALVYALFLVVLGFVLKVTQALEKRLVESVAQWCEANIRIHLSRYRRAYYKGLIRQHWDFNTRGLRVRGHASRLDLDRVYVQVRVAAHLLRGSIANPVRRDQREDTSSIWSLLADSEEQNRVLAIIGPPGSGKSTLLQHIVLTFTRNRQRHHHPRCGAYVPIHLTLRDHAQTVTSSDPPDLAELVTELETKAGREPPRGWFEEQLELGRCIVLLDGLDEVDDIRQRKAVVSWVERQTKRRGENRFIITSRPHGFESARVEFAMMLEVQPFTLAAVSQFVDNWYRASELRSSGEEGPSRLETAHEDARDLVRQIRETPSLAALAVNPLLLTMIALVHRYRGRLPRRRVELYNEICEVLLEHWPKAKGLARELTASQKRAVLEPLAYEMMRQGVRKIAVDDTGQVIAVQDFGHSGLPAVDEEADAELTHILDRAITGVGGSGAEVHQFLIDVHNGSGLLLEVEVGVFGFCHLTFQEYLAAAFVRDNGQLERDLLKRIDDGWWHETIRLYAALVDATAVIRGCLDRPEPEFRDDAVIDVAASRRHANALVLAYQCADEGKTVDQELRAELEKRILDGIDHEMPTRRSMAAAVLLALRQKKFLRLNDEVEIDTSYVSNVEYQLFLVESRAGFANRPDSWEQGEFEVGTGHEPVCGLRQRDAEAFCRWLSSRRDAPGPRPRFRLPTIEELEQAPVVHGGTNPVLAPLQGPSLLPWWTQKGKTGPLSLIDARQFAVAEHLGRIHAENSSLESIEDDLRSAIFPYGELTPQEFKEIHRDVEQHFLDEPLDLDAVSWIGDLEGRQEMKSFRLLLTSPVGAIVDFDSSVSSRAGFARAFGAVVELIGSRSLGVAPESDRTALRSIVVGLILVARALLHDKEEQDKDAVREFRRRCMSSLAALLHLENRVRGDESPVECIRMVRESAA